MPASGNPSLSNSSQFVLGYIGRTFQLQSVTCGSGFHRNSYHFPLFSLRLTVAMSSTAVEFRRWRSFCHCPPPTTDMLILLMPRLEFAVCLVALKSSLWCSPYQAAGTILSHIISKYILCCWLKFWWLVLSQSHRDFCETVFWGTYLFIYSALVPYFSPSTDRLG